MDNIEQRKRQKLVKNKKIKTRRIAFCNFVKSKANLNKEEPKVQWLCCNSKYENQDEINKHVSSVHQQEIEDAIKNISENKDGYHSAEDIDQVKDYMKSENLSFSKDTCCAWLPPVLCLEDGKDKADSSDMNVLLFYKYKNISDTMHVKSWQEELCCRLHLTGKIRVGKEGLNATVCGLKVATEKYITAVRQHPLFEDMSRTDFKESKGVENTFSGGLKVGIYDEIVPMGISPDALPFTDGGCHLSPEEFHSVLEETLTKEKDNNAVFIDCRNFYESKIGKFTGAITPDIRKFGYWPEYVNKNSELLKDKNIYMYCTGGIRCERGSAYIKSQGISQNVYQLEGGIHKYMEKYPDGHFRGKLFVFDDRFAISSNDDVISNCVYCDAAWDEYTKCSSEHCHQLVLSCRRCQKAGRTACCHTCQKNQTSLTVPGNQPKEQCQCTERRERIPLESKVS